jgi:hypothetical protein
LRLLELRDKLQIKHRGIGSSEPEPIPDPDLLDDAGLTRQIHWNSRQKTNNYVTGNLKTLKVLVNTFNQYYPNSSLYTNVVSVPDSSLE